MFDDDDSGWEQEAALVNTTPVPLAWDRNARRFPVHKSARYWRVTRKTAGRGRPSIVSTSHGPLHIEIDATFETLSEAVNNQPGWYVLYAVDENSVMIPNCPQACVEVIAEARRRDSHQSQGDAVDRLCTTVQQLVMYSAQRDEAICSALGQMTAAVSEIQRSTAELLRAASSGMDIAVGVAQPKALTAPMPQLPPPPPPPKSFMDFLTSPAGNTAVSALGNVLTSLTNGGKK